MIDAPCFKCEMWVPGDPIPKQSFRIGREGRHFQPERVTAWRDQIQRAAPIARPSRAAFDGMWEVTLTFYRKTARRVDLDNLSKAVLDALQGVWWKNDSNVMVLHLAKTQSIDPGVQVEAWPLTEEGLRDAVRR